MKSDNLIKYDRSIDHSTYVQKTLISFIEDIDVIHSDPRSAIVSKFFGTDYAILCKIVSRVYVYACVYLNKLINRIYIYIYIYIYIRFSYIYIYI